MNRRQKIIVSVTGIFLVLLILVGLTYAYFLTRIVGNTNDKSISVTTANLELVYGDGTTELLTSDTKLEPSADPINTKDFTVTNNGDDTTYVVMIENVRVKVAGTENLTTFESNDFVYTLSCEKSDGTSCNGVDTQTTLPMSDAILVENDIVSGNTHTYEITVWYLDTGVDQSADMNKTFEARINIEDPNIINPYSSNTNSLAYNIINNSLNVANGTSYMNTPLTKVAEEISSQTGGTGTSYIPAYSNITYYASTIDDLNTCVNRHDCTNATEYSTCTSDVIGKYIYDDSETIEYGPVQECDSEGNPILGNAESVLSTTQDDYGTSYYYRGNVIDNYVNFAGMCWRIVRIDGNNNIKIVLEDKNTTCENSAFTGNYSIGEENYGYDDTSKSTSGSTLYKMNYLEPAESSAENSMVKAFYDYQSTLTTKISSTYTDKTISDYLASGNWCMADTAYSRSGSSSPYTYSLLNDTSSYYLSNTSFYYDSYVRLRGDSSNGYNPTLKCTGKVMDKFKKVTVESTTIITESDMYVGALTADEIVYAGGKVLGSDNVNYYLINDFQETSANWWWALTPSYFINTEDHVFYVDFQGYVWTNHMYNTGASFRPAVSLKPGVEISDGTGVKTDPYIIN